MPMDKSEKETKKKALDLMIVLGGKPKGGPSEDDSYGKSSMNKGCKCSCCGKPCEYCMKEDKEEDYEEEE